MKKLLASAFLSASLCVASLFAASPADATVLLDLTNQPVTPQTLYSLSFFATGTSTYVALGGYQLPSYIQATGISVTPYGTIDPNTSNNLLDPVWSFQPAPVGQLPGQYTDQFDDTSHGTGTNGVEFGSIVIGSYDYYYQYVNTIPGQEYNLTFLYTQDYEGPNGFLAIVDQPAIENPVPEPTSWAMMIFGLGAAGLALRCRRNARLAAIVEA